MSIARDDCDERQIRVDRMFEEFGNAESRRLAKATTAKGNSKSVESQRDVPPHAAAATSTPAPGSSHQE